MRNLTLCRLFALRLCLFISAGSAEAGQEAVAQPNASEGLSKKTNAKKAAPDDFFTLHNQYAKLADETYLQRFHGINLTGEFISEIIPPPPKA